MQHSVKSRWEGVVEPDPYDTVTFCSEVQGKQEIGVTSSSPECKSAKEKYGEL